MNDTRWVSFGGIWYRHFGHSVVNDAITLARLILRLTIIRYEDSWD